MSDALPIGHTARCPRCTFSERVASDYQELNDKLLRENRDLIAQVKALRGHALTAIRQLNVIADLSVLKRRSVKASFEMEGA